MIQTKELATEAKSSKHIESAKLDESALTDHTPL